MEYPELSETAIARVRLTFNPSGSGQVQELKEAAAHLITLIERVQLDKPTAAREAAIAITHVQTASMFAVFAATS